MEIQQNASHVWTPVINIVLFEYREQQTWIGDTKKDWIIAQELSINSKNSYGHNINDIYYNLI